MPLILEIVKCSRKFKFSSLIGGNGFISFTCIQIVRTWCLCLVLYVFSSHFLIIWLSITFSLHIVETKTGNNRTDTSNQAHKSDAESENDYVEIALNVIASLAGTALVASVSFVK